ncbi:DUF3798 domain-containing protein [uncultured Anaerococcus sp.]|uniref:DUF3798 domain-containing protein n=1 Tax=uncultured Anaerococcus sp. TaxID=293428 RepID=UPI0025DFE03F|nr:DUF3798 domain-containing protein [uncultured Anaerococcus sp.]
MKSMMKKMTSLFLLAFVFMGLIGCQKVDDKAASNDPKQEAAESKDANDAKDKDAAEVTVANKAQYEKLKEGEDYHIGLVTGTVSQSEDEIRGAEAAIKKYGKASEGGVIVHDTYPDRFEAEMETTISKIKAMADDPKMKAIIVNQSVPGTTAAFTDIRKSRPDIILVDLTPQEDILMTSGVADLVVDVDNISRGYRMIKAAQKMGAKKFAHITFPRHMAIETLAIRRAIMEEACKDLGMEFISLNAPDPTTDIGVPGAQQYLAENIGPWIEKYGKDTAFFTTNDALTEPLLRGVAQGGAIFVEPDLPSPIMGYPSAFSIGLDDIAGDWPKILKRVEEVVIEKGGKDRMGTWAYSLGYSSTLAAVDLVTDVLNGKADINNADDIKKAFEAQTDGAKWVVSKMVNMENGEELPNFALVAQDTYVFGKGYLGMTEEKVDDKYRKINVNVEDMVEKQKESEGKFE